ncbi:urea ABC transporter permease subunit UrtC [Frankia sp. CNm7]|uniref:Urea ABC transporter permease subunit UrtC n=1 Tax=Frankia nepalensis TaxID=1836974 RepID=A0A937RJX9_9ACTN|nr:urea ABC transporter permease subunit UrtC [Frankia nepalensis]MBL7496442.1 urea ABC transporter permease subunit UrtC [Frankia nepalensis]MBL7512836.1 urea ABC transporter permease subunit UrtC [Frankia nepalensis]MBL7522381.1 urea ABC transporter permease subunit UrtC [Frankia nepalensis]MBL7630229.1 urea ABC transporter permease subunit UrtC [Frankia nepalensis]
MSAPVADAAEAPAAGKPATSGGWRARVVTPQLPWRVVFIVVLALGLLAPFVLDPAFRLPLFTKYLCYAIVGVGIALAWGHGGMLTLGQGLFVGLGGYSMGMYLKLHEAGPGNVPDFMSWSGVEKLPAFWEPFRNPVVAIIGVIVLPIIVATVLGLLVFRQRVRGAYFAILTQALTAAFVILLIGQQGYTGGTNGLTNFGSFFGINLFEANGQRKLYFVTAGVLLVIFLLLRLVVASRFGRLLLAIRDGEDRVRFLGYDPTVIKTIAFAISAVTASVGGALIVPVVGIINPGMLDIVPSIELVIAVAVGGRYSLAGAVIGAVVVNWARTNFSEDYPSGWTYFQGALFIGVIAFLPRGIAGIVPQVRDGVPVLLKRLGITLPTRSGPPGGPPAAPPPGGAPVLIPGQGTPEAKEAV